jgi:cytochrome c peroxidase
MMHHRGKLLWSLIVLALLVSAGCKSWKKAGMFGPKAPSRKKEEKESARDKSSKQDQETKKPRPKKQPAEKKPAPLPADYAWLLPDEKAKKQLPPEVPIHFVHQGTKPEQWNQLDSFWTLRKRKPTTPLGKARVEVLIKVPLGLDDPTPLLPASNPPTVARWELGKRLFFDENYLYASRQDSCATCHKPERGFTEGMAPNPNRMRTPTLFNVVYNTYLFWDGRASALEEVVQRTLEDERIPTGRSLEAADREAERRHVWSGVVRRLRASKDYKKRFQKVFGTLPTQDNVGKALATYLRTILIGDSLFDKARDAVKSKEPKAADYQKLLDKDIIKQLMHDKAKPEDAAALLARGRSLFLGQARCVQCHREPNFTDNDFHNIGVPNEDYNPKTSKTPGRIAQVPVGRKAWSLFGAFKTPTLRGLPQTAPYFHNGITGTKDDALADAVIQHVKPAHFNPFLDPKLRDEKDPDKHINLKLGNDDIHALLVFLRALDGKVDEVVADPKKQPDGVD